MWNELGKKHEKLRSQLTVLDSQTVRHSRTGEHYAVQILGFMHGKKALVYYIGTGGDQDNWVSEPFNSRSAANAKLRRVITAIGGRRLNNEWVICSSSMTVKGWKNVPWPGEPINRPFYV